MKSSIRVLSTVALVITVGIGAYFYIRSGSERADRVTTPGTAKHADKNVVLIILDTVRADRLGCYGNKRGLTPHIDAFAQESIRFSHAYSHAPWTLASTASLYTSLYPVQHTAGGRFGSFKRLPEDAITLAEVFKDAGSRTAAILNVVFLGDMFGMAQGFDDLDIRDAETNFDTRRAADTTDAAIEWLGDQGDEPFFLVVHYFDAHLVYDPPQPFRRKFAADEDAETEDWLYGTVEDMVRLRTSNGLSLPAPSLIHRLEKLYDGEIAYMDFHVGRLLDAIESLGLSADTVIALTSDHGEEFLDHGGFEHGHTLYDELLHVPLILRPADLPQNRKGETVATTVRLIDVAPTLVATAGISLAPGFEGRSLVDLIEGKREDDRIVLSQAPLWGPSAHSLRVNDDKVICRIQEGRRPGCRLYETSGDPRELKDLAKQRPKKATLLLRQLIEMVKALEQNSLQAEEAEITPEGIESLRSLGYTG